MNPPRVYDVTKPNIHSTSRITKIVQSMLFLRAEGKHLWGHYGTALVRGRTKLRVRCAEEGGMSPPPVAASSGGVSWGSATRPVGGWTVAPCSSNLGYEIRSVQSRRRRRARCCE